MVETAAVNVIIREKYILIETDVLKMCSFEWYTNIDIK